MLAAYWMVVSLPTSLVVAGGLALLFVLLLLLAGMFAPLPRYRIQGSEGMAGNDSEEFLKVLEALTDAKVNRAGVLEVLTNGPSFYPAALEAIRGAKQSICLEAYIFQPSEIGRMYLEAMAERARAGVQVNVTLDAFGSFRAGTAFFKPLMEAGGKVRWYNRPRWYSFTRMDSRTHRELLIVDGEVGFIGGAGVADQWLKGVGKSPRWRDTVVRMTGDAVPSLLSTFAENWLCADGELLVGERYFPQVRSEGDTVAMVVNSTPTPGGSTRARVLMQLLLASAKQSISIQTPYFLPDKGLVEELCRAVERGVRVRVLVPGRKADHVVTRSTSRAGYGPLLKAGAEVFEYKPAMIHAKVLVVDGLWAVVGSTNFDNRSFGINDEVNLAVREKAFAARLESDTARDLADSRRVSLEQWKHRPVTERAPEMFGWLFERLQ